MTLPESHHKGVSSLASSYAAVMSLNVDVQKGRLLGDMSLLSRTIDDIENNKCRTLLYSFRRSKGEEMSPGFPFEIPSNSWFPSPSGEKLCVIHNDDSAACQEGKSGPESAQSDLCSIELWSVRDGTLLRRLSSGLAHDKIVLSERFGGVEWSPDETTLLYVAQVKYQPGKSFFDVKQHNGSSDFHRNGDTTSHGGEEGDLNLYRDDWGETCTDIHDLGLFMMNLDTGKVVQVPVAKETTPDTPIFTKSGDTVLYVAYENQPTRLGMKFCYNRPCKLYAIRVASLIEHLHTEDGSISSAETIEESSCCLTPDDRISLSPRINPCGVLREEDVGQPGKTLHRMMLCQVSVLADCESEPSEDIGGGYTGVWPIGGISVIPQNCWAPDGSVMFLSTLHGPNHSVFKVDKSGVKRLQLEREGEQQGYGSFILLDVGYDGLLVSFSSPNLPASFAIVPFDVNKKGYAWLPEFRPSAIARRAIAGSASNLDVVDEAVRGIRWRIMHVQPQDDPVCPKLGCILLLPSSKQPGVNGGDLQQQTELGSTPRTDNTMLPSSFPLIVMVHGGPHSHFGTIFSKGAAYLCATQRKAILMVNYRGTTGFGDKFLNSLPGHVGIRDLQDVHQATLQALQEEECIDPKRVCIYGGSHGGFLSCHASARYPELYKVAIILNPVTNFLSMANGSSDIPDWPWTEVLGCGSFDFNRGYKPLDENAMCAMWKQSPMAYENGAIGPTLLALALKDRRVHHSNGMEWYRALKTRGVNIKLLTYKEENHMLAAKPANHADFMCNVAKWLRDEL